MKKSLPGTVCHVKDLKNAPQSSKERVRKAMRAPRLQAGEAHRAHGDHE